MNNVTLLGRIANDIDIKYTTTGKAVLNITLAVDGIKKDDTQFVKCIIWDKSAEYLSNYHVKGNRLLIEGRIENRSWQDADGTKRFATEIVANRVTGIDFKPKEDTDVVEEEDISFDDPFDQE